MKSLNRKLDNRRTVKDSRCFLKEELIRGKINVPEVSRLVEEVFDEDPPSDDEIEELIQGESPKLISEINLRSALLIHEMDHIIHSKFPSESSRPLTNKDAFLNLIINVEERLSELESKH